MKLVQVKSHKKTDDNEILVTYEMFTGDTAEDQLYSLPGFESIPLDSDKLLRIPLDNGDNALFMIPLKSELKKGERRIYATDEDGSVTAEIGLKGDKTAYIKNSEISVTIDTAGKIEISATAGDLTAFISELATNYKDLITSLATATVPTALGPQLLSIAPGDLVPNIPIVTLLASNIDSFKK